MDDQSARDLIALRPLLLQRARRFGLARHDSEDVAQDVMLAALADGRRLTGEDLKAWCCTVLRNRIFNIKKSAHFRRTESLDDREDTNILQPSQEHVVLLRQVGTALGTMPRRAARLIRTISIEGRSIAEVAEAEGVANGTISSGLHRARALLDRKLERQPMRSRRWLPLTI
jgi:RNA polymerase sigma-70 factor, ECF subfamily